MIRTDFSVGISERIILARIYFAESDAEVTYAFDYGITREEGTQAKKDLKKLLKELQMIQWGKEAMESGIITGREITGYASNGLKFTGFIDLMTGEVTNFFPVLK